MLARVRDSTTAGQPGSLIPLSDLIDVDAIVDVDGIVDVNAIVNL